MFGRLVTVRIANSRPFITTAAAKLLSLSGPVTFFSYSSFYTVFIYININCLYLAAIPLAHDAIPPPLLFPLSQCVCVCVCVKCVCSVSKRPWQPVHSKTEKERSESKDPWKPTPGRGRKKKNNFVFFLSSFHSKWPQRYPLMDSYIVIHKNPCAFVFCFPVDLECVRKKKTKKTLATLATLAPRNIYYF